MLQGPGAKLPEPSKGVDLVSQTGLINTATLEEVWVKGSNADVMKQNPCPFNS